MRRKELDGEENREGKERVTGAEQQVADAT